MKTYRIQYDPEAKPPTGGLPLTVSAASVDLDDLRDYCFLNDDSEPVLIVSRELVLAIL